MRVTSILAAIAASLFFSFSVTGQPAAPSFSNYPEYSSPEKIPSRVFASDSAIERIQLSPNGKYYLKVTPRSNLYRIEVLPFDGGNRRSYLSTDVHKSRYRNVFWANNDRILIQTSRVVRERNGDAYEHKMLFGVQFDSNDIEPLFKAKFRLGKTYTPDLILHLNPDENDKVVITFSDNGRDWSGIHELDVYTGETEEIGQGKKYIDDWRADSKGRVRFGSGWHKKKFYMVARASVEDDWQYLDTNAIGDAIRFEFLAFDSEEPTFAYVKSTQDLGRDAIYRFNLTSGQFQNVFYQNERLDAGWLVLSPRAELLAAVSQGDRLERHYFKKDYQELALKIDALLPDKDNVIVQTTANQRYALVFSTNDRYPGAYYRYDALSNDLLAFGEINPSLNPDYLQPKKPFKFTARDGLVIPGYLTLPRRPDANETKPALVVMPHGGPWVRDTQAYDFWAQYLVAQGYAVLQPNFRGSDGFGREFERAAEGEWGGAMIDDLADGARSLVNLGVVDEQRMCVVGGSFGGYAALMSSARYSDKFKCVVAVAPISDLKRWANRLKKQVGPSYYSRILGTRGTAVFKEHSPIKLARIMSAPVLLMHGMSDQRVDPEHSVKMNKALLSARKDVTFIEVEGEGHLFLAPKNRTRLLNETSDFLAEFLK